MITVPNEIISKLNRPARLEFVASLIEISSTGNVDGLCAMIFAWNRAAIHDRRCLDSEILDEFLNEIRKYSSDYKYLSLLI